MSDLQSNLKQWGAQGTEYPDGYNYLEGEQPVDEWDNHLTYHTIEEIHSLQSVVNDRIESDSGTSVPGSPETPHLFYDTDDDAYKLYTGSEWHRLVWGDAAALTGNLDLQGNSITSSSGTTNIATDTSISGDATIDGSVTANGASLVHDWFSKHEGGTVGNGSAVPMGTWELEDGESLKVTQASLTKDGLNTAVKSGVALVCARSDGTYDTILTGDGSAVYTDEVGSPLYTYTNTTGAAIQVTIALDNGNYDTGAGNDIQAFAGYIARRV